MHENVERVVQCDRIGLLPDQKNAALQPVMADVLLQRRGHGAGSGEQEFGFGNSPNHFPGGPHENPLAFAHGQVEATDHAKDGVPRQKPQDASGGIRESAFPRKKLFCVDAGMDDMEFPGIKPARRAVVPFRHGGGGVAVSFGEDLGHKAGDSDDRVRFGEKTLPAERRFRAFGQVPGKDDFGAGLDQTCGQQGGPVVVSVVGVDDPGAGASEKAGQSYHLERPKFR